MYTLSIIAALWGCTSGDFVAPAPTETGSPQALDSTSTVFGAREISVRVTLDGLPTEGIRVSVDGGPAEHTDTSGMATVVAPGLSFLESVVVSHPEVRTTSKGVPADGSVEFALTRFDRSDNLDYVFQDPGSPTDNGNTGKCAHCHDTLVRGWDASTHRSAASNPHVQDVYAGVAAAFSSATDCEAAGGRWREGLTPGAPSMATERCYVGAGTLPDLNPTCGEQQSCDSVATSFGGCADCHAPGIDGALGGRDLLEATGFAYRDGVHCDVCHKVESVDLSQPAGVAGALGLLRPSEASTMVGMDFAPLTFGPRPDVPNPRMGAVARDLFHASEFCGACHELHQPVWVGEVDSARWPTGTLPIHTTYSEWASGPLAPQATCQGCHMPPDATVGNGADIDSDDPENVANGYLRPPGSVRHHTWDGPRSAGSGMLQLAAAVDLEVVSNDDGGLWVRAFTQNVGPGHAIPTGEPLRNLVLLVEARCAGVPIEATGGDVVPGFAGALAVRARGEDWESWPGARVGQVVRVVQLDGYRDYVGPGPFGDGRFDVQAKGLANASLLAQRTIVAVAPDGRVQLDGALPDGDVAWLGEAGGLAVDGAPIRALAGAPGFAFAKVLTDASGAQMVPHHRANDVQLDNRLLPQQGFETLHRFAPGCASPELFATLSHRAAPPGLVAERGWTVSESVMVEASR